MEVLAESSDTEAERWISDVRCIALTSHIRVQRTAVHMAAPGAAPARLLTNLTGAVGR